MPSRRRRQNEEVRALAEELKGKKLGGVNHRILQRESRLLKQEGFSRKQRAAFARLQLANQLINKDIDAVDSDRPIYKAPADLRKRQKAKLTPKSIVRCNTNEQWDRHYKNRISTARGSTEKPRQLIGSERPAINERVSAYQEECREEEAQFTEDPIIEVESLNRELEDYFKSKGSDSETDLEGNFQDRGSVEKEEKIISRSAACKSKPAAPGKPARLLPEKLSWIQSEQDDRATDDRDNRRIVRLSHGRGASEEDAEDDGRGTKKQRRYYIPWSGAKQASSGSRPSVHEPEPYSRRKGEYARQHGWDEYGSWGGKGKKGRK